MQKKIYLIDGNSFIYRMFFALPEFSTKEGRVVNATFGMAKFFTGQLVKEKPDMIVFVKDAKGNNFRHDIYPEYKATRERMPDSLREQIGDIERMIGKMNIDIIEIPGYEADDVIGTLAKKLEAESNNEIYILSGDKDLYALVSEQVKIYDTQKKKISGPAETREKFWIDAPYVTDYLSICGDKSDNIPGVSGIGPKKVSVLINEFGTVEEIYEVIDKVVAGDLEPITFSDEVQKLFRGKTFEKLRDGKENAFLSKRLATLDCSMDLKDFHIENYVFHPEGVVNTEVEAFFEELEFHSLIQTKRQKYNWEQTGKKIQIIGDEQWLDDLAKKITSCREIVLDTETTNLKVQDAGLVWVSILLDEDNIYYINRLHSGPCISDDILKIFLENILNSDIKIIGHNLKYDLEILTLFLQWKTPQNQENSFWQMELGV